MSTTLLHPAYFGAISNYVSLVQASEVIFENEDNYQKQTYRNRMYIYGANGKLLLNIPIKHRKSEQHQKYKDVKIENDFQWQKVHWKSLETAYRTSPFFEYYEDEFVQLFEKKQTYLLDFNYQCMQAVLECLQLDQKFTKTTTYNKVATGINDHRPLINSKAQQFEHFTPYTQVFESKAGFIPNLSILDVLFNEGTNALTYLEEQKLAR